MTFIYKLEGLHCSSCIEKIKTALSPHYQIIDATLNPPLLKIESNSSPNLDELNKLISSAGKYRAQPTNENITPLPEEKTSYYPIFLIAAYIFGVATINNVSWTEINWHGWMNQFMAGFFLVFSGFKLLNLPGFAEGYASYDLLARRWYPYGYIYPFLELTLGILYLTMWFPIATPIATIILMSFSSLGVIKSLLKKQKIQCACLGTILKVPLSSITLIEDLTMVAMAILSLAY